MSRNDDPRTDALRPSRERLQVEPLATLQVLAGRLAGSLAKEEPRWGLKVTPREVELLRLPAAGWREQLAEADLQEVRIFDDREDLHWLYGRGVALRAVSEETPAGPAAVGGEGWLERDRRSRLWGELLEGRDLWYEERIPDPRRYGDLEPTAENLLAFLRYREYIQGGAVRYVRYLGVEGGPR